MVAPPSCGGYFANTEGGVVPQSPQRSCSAVQQGEPPPCWYLPCTVDGLHPVGQPGTVSCGTGACEPNQPTVGGQILTDEHLYVTATQFAGGQPYDGAETARSAEGAAVTEANESKFHTVDTYAACKLEVQSGLDSASNCAAWNAAAVVNKGLNFEKVMLERLSETCVSPPLAHWRYRTVPHGMNGSSKPSDRLRIADAFCPDGLPPGPGTGTMHEFKCFNSSVPGQKRQDGFLWQAAAYISKANYARCALSHGGGRELTDDLVFGGPRTRFSDRYAPIHLVYQFCDSVPDWAGAILAEVQDEIEPPEACAQDFAFTTPGQGGIATVEIASPDDGTVPEPPAGGFIGTDGTQNEVCEFGYVADDAEEEHQNGTPRFVEVPDADFECESAMVPEAARDPDCASEQYDRCDSGW